MSTSHPYTHMHRSIHAYTSHVHRSHSYTLWVIIFILTLNLIYSNIIHPFCFLLDILVMASHSYQPSILLSIAKVFWWSHKNKKQIRHLKKKQDRCLSKVNNNSFVAKQLKKEVFTHAQSISGLGFPFHSLQSGFYMILGTPLLCCKITER